MFNTSPELFSHNISGTYEHLIVILRTLGFAWKREATSSSALGSLPRPSISTKTCTWMSINTVVVQTLQHPWAKEATPSAAQIAPLWCLQCHQSMLQSNTKTTSTWKARKDRVASFWERAGTWITCGATANENNEDYIRTVYRTDEIINRCCEDKVSWIGMDLLFWMWAQKMRESIFWGGTGLGNPLLNKTMYHVWLNIALAHLVRLLNHPARITRTTHPVKESVALICDALELSRQGLPRPISYVTHFMVLCFSINALPWHAAKRQEAQYQTCPER